MIITTLSGVQGVIPLNINAADNGYNAPTPAGTALTFLTLYTVPASKVAVLRYFYLYTDKTTADATVWAALYVQRTGLGHSLVYRMLSSAAQYKEYGSPCEIMLGTGDIVEARYTNGDAIARSEIITCIIDTLPA